VAADITYIFKIFCTGNCTCFSRTDGLFIYTKCDRLFVKNRTVELPTLTAADLQQFCDDWLTQYHTRPHRGLNDQAPLAVAAAWREPIRSIPDERQLDLLLAPAPRNDGWCTVSKSDGIAVDGYHYDAPELALYSRQRVRVLYDPEGTMEYVYCFSDKNEFIARAQCKELCGFSREKAVAYRQAQRTNMQAKDRAAKAEAAVLDAKHALEEVMAYRAEQADRLVAFPPRTEEHRSAGLDGARQALDAQQPPVASVVTAEQMAALREQMRREEEAKAAKANAAEPDHPSVYARAYWIYEQVLRGKVADIPAEWKEFVRWYYREDSRDHGRLLDITLSGLYPRFSEAKAALLWDGEDAAQAAS
jgi:hypothetical protein